MYYLYNPIAICKHNCIQQFGNIYIDILGLKRSIECRKQRENAAE